MSKGKIRKLINTPKQEDVPVTVVDDTVVRAASSEPAKRIVKPVEETATTSADLRLKADNISAEVDELMKKANSLMDEAETLRAKADAADKAEALKKAKEEEERKKSKEIEKAKSHRRLYFTHNEDGSIDYDHPFRNPLDAKYFDDDYVVILCLVEGGRYVRPLTKKDL